MFANVTNYMKILRTAMSCENKDHVELTFNWANSFRRSFGLTEFEYLEIERTLLEKLKLDKSLSAWNRHLDIKKLLQSSKL
jgi:hypothetical protein